MTDHSDIIVSSNSSCTSSRAPAPARVRIVRLVRNSGLYRLSCQTATFGFSIRGGREFGIGFFVSHIDPESEADIRGLKVYFLFKLHFTYQLAKIQLISGWRSNHSRKWVYCGRCSS